MWLKRTFRLGRYCLVWAVLALSLVWVLAAASAHAAMPGAGDSITNIAGGLYFYKAREIRTNSNAVITQVAEKGGVVLTQDNEKVVMPGAWVSFPHTLTNTGNVAGKYTLTVKGLNGTDFDPTCRIFADDDNDGIADVGRLPLVNPPSSCSGDGVSYESSKLAPGASYSFVVEVQAKANATVGQTVTLTVAAKTDAGGVSSDQTNTDKAKVVSGDQGAFEVTKRVDKDTASAGDKLRYTFTIINRGTQAAATTITDKIGVASDTTATPKWSTQNLEYAGGGRWSQGAAEPLKDDDPEATEERGSGTATDGRAVLKYNVKTIAGGKEVKIELSAVPINTYITVSFDVTVKSTGLQVGSLHSKNLARYNSSGAPCVEGAGSCVLASTNAVFTTVMPTYKVVLNSLDNPPAPAPGADFPGTDGTMGTPKNDANDKVEKLNASAGGTMKFINYAWNRGDTEDSVRLSVTNSTFPSGTTIAFFQPDGDEIGVPLAFGLTPPIKPNEKFKFLTVVVLPANAAGGPFQVDVLGTSRGNPTNFDAVRNILSEITAAKLELAHDAGGTLKWAGGTSSVTSCTLPSGTTAGSCTPAAGGSLVGTTQVVFPLFVQSSIARTFTLSAAANAAFTEAVDAAKWEVKFYEPELATGACVDGGALKVKRQITSFSHNGVETTPATTVGGTSTARFMHAACAVVTRKLARSETQSFYFKVTDAQSTSSKTLFDQVVVPGNADISLSFATTNEQVFAGSPSVEYQAVLANAGNVPLTCKFVPNITGGSPGWSVNAYLDTSDRATGANPPSTLVAFDDGIIPVDTYYVGGGKSAEAKVLGDRKALRLIFKVTAPEAALRDIGAQDQRTVFIKPEGCTGLQPPNTPSVTFTTKVIDGKLRVVLTQAAHSSCSTTTFPTNYTDQPLGRGADGGKGVRPGECVCYRVVAKHMGAAGDEALANVKVTNPIPAYTKLLAAAECATDPVTVGVETAGRELGGAGTTTELRCGAASLAAQQSLEMKFCVKIDQ